MITSKVFMFIKQSTISCTNMDVIMSCIGRNCGDWLKEVKYDS